VDEITAHRGFGPFLYDLALEEVRRIGGKGVYPDRSGVSPAARNVWERFYEARPDVRSSSLPPSLPGHDKYHFASGGPFDFLDRIYAKNATPFLDALSRTGRLRRPATTPYDALHAAAGSALRAWMDKHRDEIERRMHAPATVREYRYGVRNRPPGYGTVPKGYIRVEPARPGEPRTRHGIVVYDHPLTDEEVRGYEMHPYMPLAEVVDRVIASFGEYAGDLASDVREAGDRMIRESAGAGIDRISPGVYTDIPLGDVYERVAEELLRRFPA
jgi:hypothetical protein